MLPELETHPWPAFVPEGAKYLIAGTFPPAAKRWSMDFFYPNPTNDFWRIMGLIFYNDKNALWLPDEKRFKLPEIKRLLTREGIAMSDTAKEVRRLKGNASDKFLEIVTPFDFDAILRKAPGIKDVATTGEKAAAQLAQITGTEPPKMGEYTEFEGIRLWRMPSTSRAYPLLIERKADYYRKLFNN